MKVQDLLKAKKNVSVLTVRPDDTVSKFVKLLRAEGVGAMVVSRDGQSLDGIISERDVVRACAINDDKVLSLRVSDIMTKSVITCSPDDSVADVALTMTRREIRHLPVTDAQKRLVSLISIGEVLNDRIAEIQVETTMLRDIAIAGHSSPD